MKKKALLIIPALVAAGAAVGYYKTHKPIEGDKEEFLPDPAKKKETELDGKTIIFLGSSVTYGRDDISFVEYLKKEYGVNIVKEALSGTTLVDKVLFGKKPYVQRIKSIDKNLSPDLFVCQLSTNDATTKRPLGQVGESFDIDSFDINTVAGAIEYIIAYAKKTWHCPVAFYTNTRYDSEHYEAMVKLLLQIKDKWNIGVIDLYNELDGGSYSQDRLKLYMADKIHPSLAGYKEWWTPFFAKKIMEILKEQ